jgi:dethiobiotin synthetase
VTEKRLFVTGIGTGIGKTIVSSILVRALNGEYWKPVQSGSLDHTDSDEVARLVPTATIHREEFRLSAPLSPHAAARIEGITIPRSLTPPVHTAPLVIEGAGGILVPLSDTSLIVDLVSSLAIPVVVVSRHYLGSINHTLLTLEALRARDISVLGVVFNGPPTPESEHAITTFGRVRVLGAVREEATWSPEIVDRYAHSFCESLTEFSP